MDIQAAQKTDAEDLAFRINLAGEGLPMYLWSSMAEGDETSFDVGIRRASRDEGSFSYKNARVIRDNDRVAGMIIDYALDDPYESGDLSDYPEVIRPLIKLEAKAPGTWYINGLATQPDLRQKGIAKALMLEAENTARQHQIQKMSIIVASENTVAKQMYSNMGYRKVAELPVNEYPNAIYGGSWELMLKQLS
jgi:ribosomal protein S18 acetylase RimI-like enzyme